MSVQNFTYAGCLGGGGVIPETKTFAVELGAVQSINIGDAVVVTAGLAAKVANGGMAAAGKFGRAVSNSTDTVGADGVVDVQFCPGGLVCNGVANGIPTEANLFTGFKLAVAAGVQTVDLGNAGVATLWSPTPLPSTTTSVQVVFPWAV
jgi:hypothetical protein